MPCFDAIIEERLSNILIRTIGLCLYSRISPIHLHVTPAKGMIIARRLIGGNGKDLLGSANM
jgi:hypothetical protein